MGAHVLASSLRSHAAAVVASPVGGRNTRRPVGRTRKNGRADTVISWAGRARPIRPAPCAWYLSFLRLFFPAGAGRCAPRSGRKAGSFGWFRVFRATAQHGPRWGGGSVGAFPGGPAGRWRVSFAQPAVVRAGVRPLPLSGCWRCRSPLRCLWVAAQPVILICLPAGVPVCFCVLGPGVGFCLARSAFRPAPNGARVCVVGGWVVVVGPRPRCPLGPLSGRARAKCGACTPECRGLCAAPGGGGLLRIRYTARELKFAETRSAQPASETPGWRNCAGGWFPALERERPRRGRCRPPWAGSVRFQLRYWPLRPYRKSDSTANTPALDIGRKGTQARKG